MKKNRFWALLLTLILVISLFPSAMAAETETQENMIDLGNGFYIVETIAFFPLSRAGDTVRGTSTYQLYQGTTLIGVTIIGGVFEVSGSSVTATAGYITGTGYSGWSYTGGSTSCSGNTVYGTATYRSDTGATKSHSGSVTYTPN